MDVYIDVEESGRISGYALSPFSEDCVKVEMEEGDPFFTSFGLYAYVDGEVVKDISFVLSDKKREKDRELNEACKRCISEGFTHMIDGVEYHFSFDTEAQLNFQGAIFLFAENKVDEIMWTVRRGEVYERIPITKGVMDELALVILQHKDTNIRKYRDTLLPLLNEATTFEEVDSIKW